MASEETFKKLYAGLNKAQKEAVDTIEGPVMVIAGPGTGKTQVLALRIANILQKTDASADGILCLTFTNSGVKAMRERLLRLIGREALKLNISTFHAFAASLIDEFYESLKLDAPPTLLDEREAVLLADSLLEEGEWEHLRTRAGGAHNFRDLRSLISFLKREGVSPEDFKEEIDSERKSIEDDPENVSSRGKSKGSLKSDALGKLERLERTLEAARFYKEYESRKKEEGLADYDDILDLAAKLLEVSEEARASVAERYLYVLVDEHQDSSGIQNRFLELVWGKVEKPNLFAVGDDRQLIYGFGGASLSHFESFRENFPGTKLITLIENYRSTQSVLDAADRLLSSSLAEGKLKSQSGEAYPLRLVEAQFPRDEILAAGLAVKEKIEAGLAPEDCAILVPKNYQVRSAVEVLKDLGLPVASHGKSSFFSMPEAKAMLSVMKAISRPLDPLFVSSMLLEPGIHLPVIEVQKLLRDKGRKMDIESLAKEKGEIGEIGKVCLELVESSNERSVYDTLQKMVQKLFFDRSKDHARLVREVEAARTLIHITLSRLERDHGLSLEKLSSFLERLEEYGEDLPVAVFAGSEGVRVMTLHSSKGLEFDFVWVAHLDEKSVMKGKNAGFTLPEKLTRFVSKKDEESARRELYVAITRAKRFCTLSYALESYSGGELSLANIVAEMREEDFEKTSATETEEGIRAKDPLLYVAAADEIENEGLKEVRDWVKEEYSSISLSVTHLNNFFGCPWRWYFRNFLRLPEPESEALLFGNLVHALVEKGLQDRRVPEEFDEALDKLNIYSEPMRKRFAKDAEKALSVFSQNILPYVATQARSEMSLRCVDEETSLSITGKIDLLEKLEEGLRVTDFKTGKPKKSDDYLRQLAMYSYLLINQKKSERPALSRLVFLEALKEKDLIFEAQIGAEEIVKLKSEIVEYDQALKSGEWVERSCEFKPSQFERECPYCSFANRLFK